MPQFACAQQNLIFPAARRPPLQGLQPVVCKGSGSTAGVQIVITVSPNCIGQPISREAYWLFYVGKMGTWFLTLGNGRLWGSEDLGDWMLAITTSREVLRHWESVRGLCVGDPSPLCGHDS